MTGTASSPVVVAMPETAPEPPLEDAPNPVPTASNDAGKPAPNSPKLKTDPAKHPLVKAVMETFPGSSIEDIRVAPDSDEGDPA